MSLFAAYMEEVQQSYNEGDHIKFSELPKEAQKILHPFTSGIAAWRSVHGDVVEFNKVSIDEKELEKIMSIKTFRFARLTLNGKDMSKEALKKLIKKTGTINFNNGSIHI